MPRVHLKNDVYRQEDFKDLVRKKMRVNKVSQSMLAHEIGISQTAFSRKLSDGVFTHRDMLITINKLNFTDDEILRSMKI